MADIDYHCPQCGRTRKLSQYAAPSGITCPDCNVPYAAGSARHGATRADPPAVPGPRDKPALKLKPKTPQPQPTPSPSPAGGGKGKAAKRSRSATTLPDDVAKAADAADAAEAEQPVQRAYVKDTRRPTSHTWLAWLLFAAIGGIMWGCRYGGWLPPEPLAWLQDYGWIVVVAFHILIVLKAMSDNMLQGVLSLLVPGYSLYYIFVVSDDFFLRAAFAGLLVGMGQDAAFEINMRAHQITTTVHRFIEAGGGRIR